MSDGLYTRCEECGKHKMLYPGYLWVCKTCFDETVEQFEDFEGAEAND